MCPSNGRLARGAILLHGAMAAGFAIVLARHLASPLQVAQTDFAAFVTGWSMILRGLGGRLYEVAAQRSVQQALAGGQQFHGGLLAFLHPPHAALAGLPLGWVAGRFGEPAAFVLWAGGNVLLAAHLVRACGRLAAPASRTGRWLVATAILAFFPVFVTVREGQLALLLTVAFLRLYLATRDGRDPAAAGWLLILSFKPQLLPMPLVLLAVLRRWRTLGLAALFGAVAGGLTCAVLGGGIFARYLRGLGPLQRYLGNGTPAAMTSARGFIARLSSSAFLAGPTFAIALSLVAAAALGFTLRRAPRNPAGPPLARLFGFTYAAAIVFSPHLFVPDLTLWVVPLTLGASGAFATREATARFSRFALAWPILFAFTLACAGWPRLFLETATLASFGALVALVPRPSLRPADVQADPEQVRQRASDVARVHD